MLKIKQLTKQFDSEGKKTGYETTRPLLLNPEVIERVKPVEPVESENELLYSGPASRVYFKEGNTMLAPTSARELQKRIIAELHGESPERKEATRKLEELGGPTRQVDYKIG